MGSGPIRVNFSRVTAAVTGDGGLIFHLQTPYAVLRFTAWLPPRFSQCQ